MNTKNQEPITHYELGNHKSAMKIHAPKVVFVISSVYPTPFAAVKEAIQNAVDAGSKRVEITIDLYGKRKPQERCIIVRDNGKGLSGDEFSQRMSSIGNSEKADDSATLGRHGLGLMSFLGKARSYTFTSCSKATKGKPDWEGYICHDLANPVLINDDLIVNGTLVPYLMKTPAWWNTEVMVKGFEVQRLLIPLDALAEEIRSDFNLAMLQHGTEIVIIYTDARGKTTKRSFGARNFTGQRLKQHMVKGEKCGRISFEVYRLKEPTGVITIKTVLDSYAKDWNKLRDQAVSQGMTRERADVLGAGYLEGVITVENCEWDFDRSGFKPTDDVAWFELVMAINEWMESEDVQRHLKDVMGQKEEEREFGFLKKLSDHFSVLFIRDADLLYESLINLPAAVSSGHIPIEEAKRGYSGSTRRVPGKIIRTETTAPTGRKKGKKEPVKERDQSHFSVENDKGNSRYVSKTQLGLSFGIRSIKSYDYFEWDLENGILVINRDHPYYQAIKQSEEKIWVYLLGIAEWAICMLVTDDANEVVRTSTRQMEAQYMRFLTDRISQMKTSAKT